MELMVAIALIGVVMSGLTVFFVRSTALNHLQGETQVATQLAEDAMSRVRAMRGPALVTGRDQSSVTAQYAAAVPEARGTLSAAQLAYDAAAAPNSGAGAPLSTAPRDVTSVPGGYQQHFYVGRCWRANATDDCTAANSTAPNPVEFMLAVVAVTWPSKDCALDLCRFVSSTLVSSAIAEPDFTPPVLAAIWATGTTAYAATNGRETLWLGSSQVTVAGLIHSEANLSLEGSSMTLSGSAEYVIGPPRLVGSTTGGGDPTATQVSGGGRPVLRRVADYAPGGSIATAATAAGTYYTPPAAQCAPGRTWNGAGVPANRTIVYADCHVTFSGAFRPLLVSTGNVLINSNNITVGDPANPAAGGIITSATTPASTGPAAIEIAGGRATVHGIIQAAGGSVKLRGSRGDFRCGVIGRTVEIEGSQTSIIVDSACES